MFALTANIDGPCNKVPLKPVVGDVESVAPLHYCT